MLSDKYHITSVQITGSSPRTVKARKGFLKNVGVKLNFEGRIGLVGILGEEGILRSCESGFSEKQDDSTELQRLSFPTRLMISLVLHQCRLNIFVLKK